jgi:L-asparaginase II
MRIDQYRGDCLETTHPARAVAVRDGQIVWSAGPPARSPWRSAAKPLQLWCSLEQAGDPALSSEELALAASSHSGQPFHVDALRALMARLGVQESWLKCGAEAPVHRPSAEALIRAGAPALPIHNDCSGKHTLMLAACLANGWDLEYRPFDHPLQARIHEVASSWCGEVPDRAVDGCGVPVLCLSIAGMARSWARMAAAMADDPEGRLGRIGRAMVAHPRLTAGDDRIDLDVATAAAEPMAVKIGAQGVFCIALPERRLGIAIKNLSGTEPELAAAIPAVLDACAPGAWRRPERWRWDEVTNVVGRVVGRRVAVL